MKPLGYRSGQMTYVAQCKNISLDCDNIKANNYHSVECIECAVVGDDGEETGNKLVGIKEREESVDVEIILARSMTLLQQFQNPWDILTLLYVTVKYAGANLYEAIRRIHEANNDIKSWELNTVKNLWSDNRLYYPEFIPKTDITDAPTYEGEAPFIGDPTSQVSEHFTSQPHLKNTHIPTNNSSSEHYTK
ncbi:hypothetical protein M0804_001966 [Polistes exclamans]|nr:hypothetical protein M0804_001966 [Polistes exclamans]